MLTGLGRVGSFAAAAVFQMTSSSSVVYFKKNGYVIHIWDSHPHSVVVQVLKPVTRCCLPSGHPLFAQGRDVTGSNGFQVIQELLSQQLLN